MACPTGTYFDQLRTIGGLTPSHPYGDGMINIASEWDYAEWHSLVMRMRSSLEIAWKKLQEVARVHNPTGWNLQLKSVGEIVQPIRDRILAQNDPWDFTVLEDRGAQIDRAVVLATDAACAWQQVDEAIISIGATPPAHRPTIGEVPSGGLGIIGTTLLGLGGIAVAGGLIYVAAKVGKR